MGLACIADHIAADVARLLCAQIQRDHEAALVHVVVHLLQRAARLALHHAADLVNDTVTFNCALCRRIVWPHKASSRWLLACKAEHVEDTGHEPW